MKRPDRIKLLKQFSGQKVPACESALKIAENDFWKALFRLSMPETPRAELLLRLDPRAPEASAESLGELRRWFTCEPCQEAWMRIDDEDLQAAYPGEQALPMQEHELMAVLRMLEGCAGGDLVRSGLEMFYYWKRELPERAVKALLRWVEHYDAGITGMALRLFAAFPDAVPAAFGVFLEILGSREDARRYDLAWSLWTLAGQGHHFAELRIGYEALLKTGSEAEQEFGRDLLERE